MLHFELVVLCLVVFMSEPSDMTATGGIGSYRYAYTYEKVLSSGHNINHVFLKIRISHVGATYNHEIALLCTSSNERISVCKILRCFNCEQVHFLSTPMLETRRERRRQALQKQYIGYVQPPIMSFLINLILERVLVLS